MVTLPTSPVLSRWNLNQLVLTQPPNLVWHWDGPEQIRHWGIYFEINGSEAQVILIFALMVVWSSELAAFWLLFLEWVWKFPLRFICVWLIIFLDKNWLYLISCCDSKSLSEGQMAPTIWLTQFRSPIQLLKHDFGHLYLTEVEHHKVLVNLPSLCVLRL